VAVSIKTLAGSATVRAMTGRYRSRRTMLNGRLIFVVHRDETTRLRLGEAFAAMGARVRSSSCVDEARRRLETTAVLFDALVCDVDLPGEAAHGLIRTIRSWGDGRGGHMLALGLTDHATPEGKETALRAGFTGYTDQAGEVPSVIDAVLSRE
jgi:CheY-like chemotaxis protein